SRRGSAGRLSRSAAAAAFASRLFRLLALLLQRQLQAALRVFFQAGGFVHFGQRRVRLDERRRGAVLLEERHVGLQLLGRRFPVLLRLEQVGQRAANGGRPPRVFAGVDRRLVQLHGPLDVAVFLGQLREGGPHEALAVRVAHRFSHVQRPLEDGLRCLAPAFLGPQLTQVDQRPHQRHVVQHRVAVGHRPLGVLNGPPPVAQFFLHFAHGAAQVAPAVHGLDLGRQRLRPLQILLRRLVTAHRGQRQAQLRQQPQHGERRLGVRLRRQPLLVQEQRPLVVRNGRLFLVHLPVHVAQQLVHFRPGRRVPRQPELFGRQLQRLHRGFPLVQRQQRPRPPAVNLPAQGVIGGRAFVQRLLIQLQRL